jgi:protein-disulfide isomerase
MNDIVKAFPNDVRVGVKQFPLGFHKNAKFAAKAAIAAGRQGRFWEMSDIMYKNMRALEEDKLKEYARQIELNVDRFEKDYASPEIEEELKQHMAEARRIGVRGTPSFYFNGRVMKPEGRNLDGLKKLVQEELKKAKSVKKAEKPK